MAARRDCEGAETALGLRLSRFFVIIQASKSEEERTWHVGSLTVTESKEKEVTLLDSCLSEKNRVLLGRNAYKIFRET